VRDEILAAFRAGLAAVDPERTTKAASDRLLESNRDVWVAALGKAAPAMARGAAWSLGDRMAGGLAVSDHDEAVPDGCALLIGAHPVPDERSLVAGRALLHFAARVPEDADLLVLVSGGGSALAEVPIPGMGLETYSDLTQALMNAGTPISELNLVRRHLSQVKNGGLAAATRARSLVTLLMNDVIDAPASTIASGPTLSDGSSPAEAEVVLRDRLGLASRSLHPVVHRPHPDHRWEVIADGPTAARAAAASIGGTIWTETLRGEASEVAVEMADACTDGEVLVACGETTVTVRGDGSGGRNQEAALAAAIRIEGTKHGFAALGTDGIDGPTTAAGAIVDGGTVERIRKGGIDPNETLARNDSHAALTAAGDTVITGPTGTNVGDLWFALG